MTSPVILFEQECKANIAKMAGDKNLQKLSHDWICQSAEHKYSYNFSPKNCNRYFD